MGGPGSWRSKVRATLASSPNGLQPVLAEGCEVYEEVGGAAQPAGDFGLRIEHGFVL